MNKAQLPKYLLCIVSGKSDGNLIVILLPSNCLNITKLPGCTSVVSKMMEQLKAEWAHWVQTYLTY